MNCVKGQKQKLEALARKLEINKHTFFTGSLSRDKVKELLQEIDIFVMPTTCNESFGVSAVEAQAMRLPVIATKKGGIPEVVQDGKTGLLVNAKDSQQLAEAIIKLIENPELRRKMGERGQRFISENFTLEKCGGDLEEIYYRFST